MALNDQAFIAEVEALQDNMSARTDYESARYEYALQLLSAIKNYLLSSTIEITGTSSQGPFTGTGTIS